MNTRDKLDSWLIQLVREYPLIYDKSLAEFRNNDLRANAYKAIAETMGNPVQVVQARWKALREKYVRYEKQRKLGDNNGKEDWCLYETMSFLKLFIVPRGKIKLQQTAETKYLYTNNVNNEDSIMVFEEPKENKDVWEVIPTEDCSTTQNKEVWEPIPSEVGTTNQSPTRSSASSKTIPKKRKFSEVDADAAETDLPDMFATHNASVVQSDSVEAFGDFVKLSVIECLRNTKSKKRRQEKRMIILSVIGELESDSDI